MKVFRLDDIDGFVAHLADQFMVHNYLQDSDERPPAESPKKFFFTESENIFSFDGSCFREVTPAPDPFALVGVNSCDLTGIAYLDQFFADDPCYQARRRAALLVGIDCLSPCDNGFCHLVGSGPGVSEEHADLVLHALPDDRYLLMVCTESGEQAVADLHLETWTGSQVRQQRLESCIEQFDDFDHLTTGMDLLRKDAVSDSFWETLGIQCLACSGCTSLCPTCSCHDSREIVRGDEVVQQRFWDSCLFEAFQREASLHNPTGSAGRRIHRFWTHKFSETTVRQFGRTGCVGCGRCEQTCPGVIGVHSTMRRMAQYVDAGTNAG